jgi:hypothetical protein
MAKNQFDREFLNRLRNESPVYRTRWNYEFSCSSANEWRNNLERRSVAVRRDTSQEGGRHNSDNSFARNDTLTLLDWPLAGHDIRPPDPGIYIAKD